MQITEGSGNSSKITLIECEDKRTGINTDANYRLILRDDEKWKGKIRYNSMSNSIEIEKKELTDPVLYDISEWALKKYGLAAPIMRVRSALNAVAQEHRYSPVLSYLTKNYAEKEFEGTEAIDSLCKMLSTNESKHPLYKKYLRKWLVGAAMRAISPGTTFEGMLVLTGPANIGKTTFFKALGGEWWSDTPIMEDNKDSIMALHKCWIHEDGELSAMGTFKNTKLKGMITRSFDDLRLPYAATQPRMQRAFVFAGTTNESNFLSDPTGSRRFWVIERDIQLDLDKLISMRDQIWWEATHLYFGYLEVKEGKADSCNETPYLDSHEVNNEIADHNKAFYDGELWEDMVMEYVSMRSEFTINDVLTKLLKFEEKDVGRKEQVRVANILRRNNYENRTVRCPDGKNRRYWSRQESHGKK